MENKEFNYTYVAPTEAERREISDIKKQYEPKIVEEDKLTKIKKLDKKVKAVPTVAALCFGIVGTLVFGFGMAMILEWQLFLAGVIVSALGLPPIAIANPVYNLISRKMKKKYGPEILKLSEELLGE